MATWRARWFVHLPAVSTTVARHRGTGHPPLTLCGLVGSDYALRSTVTNCPSCLRLVGERPQLYNFIVMQARRKFLAASSQWLRSTAAGAKVIRRG